MSDYLFTTSISTQAYCSKPTADEYAEMKFREQTLSVDEFADKIRQGYSYCNIFNHTGVSFKTTQKSNDDFKCANMISFDCDDMSAPMDEYLTTLTIQPSIAYTSPSNGLEGFGYRYRLIYLLDQPVTSIPEYKAKYMGLLSMLRIKTNDDCGKKCAQLMNGSYNCQIKTTDTVLHTTDIPSVSVDEKPHGKKDSTAREPHPRERTETALSGTFASDWYNLPLKDILVKYEAEYGGWKRSPECEYDENGIYYWKSTDGMIVLPIYKSNDGKCKDLVKKGWRTNKSFIYATQIRLLNPHISFNGLCYALGELIYNKFEFDAQITNRWIAQQASAACAIPYEELKSSVKGRFTTSKDYAETHRMSRQEVAQDERRRVKDKAVSKYFNALKTDRENVKVLKEHGVSVSVKFIKAYRERYNLSKSDLQLERFKELVEMKCTMNEIMNELSIGRSTYFNLKKQSKK